MMEIVLFSNCSAKDLADCCHSHVKNELCCLMSSVNDLDRTQLPTFPFGPCGFSEGFARVLAELLGLAEL